MTRAILRGIAAFLLLVSVAPAQNGNSLLSRFGAGDMQLPLTARSRGLGWVSVPLVSEQDISIANPALWSDLTGLRLQGDGSYETESYAIDSRYSYGSFGLKGLQFAFPVEDQLRTRVVAGFLPVSRVGYEVSGTGAIDGESYTANYSGNGGISMFRVGAAMRPVSFLSIGAAYQYFLGSITHTSNVKFATGTYFPAVQTLSDAHGGNGWIAGFTIQPMSAINLAFAIQGATPLNVTRRNVIEYSTHDSTVTGLSGTQDIPARMSVGASWRAHRTLLTAADFTVQDWSNAQTFDGAQHLLGNSYRIGAGVEWMPAEESRLRTESNSIAYRLGFAHQRSHVRLDGRELTETFITAGLGMPIIGQNRADFALEYGWRGGSDDTLGKRSVFRFSVTVSVGELFFVRQSAD